MSSTYPEYPGGYTVPTFLDFVLQSLVDEYAERAIELPKRRYWTTGQPAADCDQAVVSLTALSYGTPGAPDLATNCDSPWIASVNVAILRCTPVSSGRSPIPEEEQIQSTAAKVAVDMELLLQLPKRLSPYRDAMTALVNAIDTEGGLSGALGTYGLAPYAPL